MRRNIILFDLDGTLTDSGPGIMKAGQYALRAFGIERDWRERSSSARRSARPLRTS